MTAPINRGTDPLSQRVYALIFNGITRGQADEYWMPLSVRERLTAAVYDELLSGGVEVRMADGLAELRRVNDEIEAAGTER
jgi:hypothetical protein